MWITHMTGVYNFGTTLYYKTYNIPYMEHIICKSIPYKTHYVKQ